MDFYDGPQYSRDSIATFDSEQSINTASSIFSVARSNSRASTNTAYSSHSQPYAQAISSFDPPQRSAPSGSASHGWPSTIGHDRQRAAQIVTDPRRLALYTAAQRAPSQAAETKASPISPANRQHTPLAEKQANNKFACSHCREVFTKKSDRKKHWHNRCQYLGDPRIPEGAYDAFVCPQCDHVARNEDQQRRHQKVSGHKGDWAPTRLCGKARYTCSNHDTIFHNAHAFYAHFERDNCPLNNHSGGKDGYRHHQARVAVLLQEGRDELHERHTHLYAALMAYCSNLGMRADAWRPIVQRLPAEEALSIANKLEWGLQNANGSAVSRLGFTDVMKMVAQAVPLSAICDFKHEAAWCVGNDSPSRSIEPSEQRPSSQPQSARSAQRGPNDSATKPASASAQAHPRSQERQGGAGFAVHRTEPLLRTNEADFTIPWPEARRDLNHSHNERRPAQHLPDASRHLPEMEVMKSTTPVFLAAMAQRTVPDNNQTHWHDEDDWDIVDQVSMPTANITASDHDHYPEFQALTPSPTKDTHYEWTIPAPPSRKRPISTSSSVLPDSIARSKAGPKHNLALRPASKDSTTSVQTTAVPQSPRTSQRSSGESIVGKWFNYANYFEQPATPTLLLPGTKGADYSDVNNHQQAPQSTTLPERSRTAGQAVKAVFRKMKTPSVREISDAPSESTTTSPPRARPISRCVHCGKIDDIACLTNHISDRRQAQARHNRRNGSILDPTAVAEAFNEFDPTFDMFANYAGYSNDSYDF
ncbi:hypothetical protein CB0940_09296 [Cercospora beticola]|uniref:Uncharacterized protein n=1 Tax=Cercospora beticola TaxID=122368 RepID=A0A2G5HGU3_CERBT|nr:hypothetical protein CB0940_09296 [Cercospora beticola]PIA91462.1 hypothetical protein CB0940_09296 [Cercospora beticola]WPB06394.1 hypothetical protein RHO25_011051 [Cercospora beticola]